MAARRSNRMLITVTVSGSPGPIRLLVGKDDSVAAVIRSVLKEYARQRRLPVLGKDPCQFDLCCGSLDRALSSCACVGSSGCRSFWMCTKVVDGGLSPACEKRLPRDRLRSLVSKSLNLISISSR